MIKLQLCDPSKLLSSKSTQSVSTRETSKSTGWRIVFKMKASENRHRLVDRSASGAVHRRACLNKKERFVRLWFWFLVQRKRIPSNKRCFRWMRDLGDFGLKLRAPSSKRTRDFPSILLRESYLAMISSGLSRIILRTSRACRIWILILFLIRVFFINFLLITVLSFKKNATVKILPKPPNQSVTGKCLRNHSSRWIVTREHPEDC